MSLITMYYNVEHLISKIQKNPILYNIKDTDYTYLIVKIYLYVIHQSILNPFQLLDYHRLN